MADRIFKGNLLVTAAIAEENARAFPEAASSFTDKPNQISPYEALYRILKDVTEGASHPRGCAVEEINGSLWVSGSEGLWIKIDPNGDVEIGEAAA